MAEFVKVAEVADVKPGTAVCVEVKGRQVGLFNVDGVFHAIDNVCLHRGGPLNEGEIDGCVVTCPWHGWQYDVTTGINTMDDTEKLDRFDTKVEGGSVFVAV
jgi:nitrite reductase/ring-hydroxylating ferredoxin subunit